MKRVFIALPIPHAGHMNHKTAQLVATAYEKSTSEQVVCVLNYLRCELSAEPFDVVISHPLLHYETLALLRTDARFANCKRYLLVDDATIYGESPWRDGFTILLQGDSVPVELPKGEALIKFPYSLISCSSFVPVQQPWAIPSLVYVGARKPERIALINELNSSGAAIEYISGVSATFMAHLYSSCLASLYLTSPGQENTVTTRALEGLQSGRFCFFHSAAEWGVPHELQFTTAEDLKELRHRALCADEELWAAQTSLLEELLSYECPKLEN